MFVTFLGFYERAFCIIGTEVERSQFQRLSKCITFYPFNI